MKRLIKCDEASGLETLLGKQVLLLCMNYFYAGTLAGVNETIIELQDPRIVYETGPWDEPAYKDAQRLHCDKLFVRIDAIEAYGVGK